MIRKQRLCHDSLFKSKEIFKEEYKALTKK